MFFIKYKVLISQQSLHYFKYFILKILILYLKLIYFR